MRALDTRSTDDVLELRVAVRNKVIVSRINGTQLERVRSEQARLARVRTDARRIGLYEVALSPERFAPYPGTRSTPDSAVVCSGPDRAELLAQELAAARFA